jgi:hypothetical protein
MNAPVLLALIGGLLVLLKVFLSERHNAIAYEQKLRALETFEAFVNASETKVFKDAILDRTTAAIFMPTTSGYTKGVLQTPFAPLQFPGINVSEDGNERL